MARRRSWLSQAIDLKPKAYRLFTLLSRVHPRAPLVLGFFPTLSPVSTAAETILEDRDKPLALARPPYDLCLPAFSEHNWDVHVGEYGKRDPFTAHVFAGVARDILIPGHTLTPVNPTTLRQLRVNSSGEANWNFAYPSPILLRRRPLSGLATIVPAYRHYGHLITDVLAPLAHALRRAELAGSPLRLVTKAKRAPLIDAFALGLSRLGREITIFELKAFEHARAERLLIATNNCWNQERAYAVAESAPFLAEIFAAAYRERPVRSFGPRLYFSRGASRLRAMTNEADLIAALRSRGFHVFEATWQNHHEQIAAFRNAEIVVGVHGAGLANLIWCKPGTQVIEIMPSTFRKTTGLHWAAEHGLGYTPFFASGEKALQAFEVDVPAFTATLDRTLARGGDLLRSSF